MKEYTVLHNHNVASSVAGFSLHDSQQGTYFSVYLFYFLLNACILDLCIFWAF